MTTYNRGDIIFVEVYFTDTKGYKPRPAVIISPDYYNNFYPDVIIMPITGNINRNNISTLRKLIIHKWEKLGLRKLSAFMPIVTSVEKTQIKKKIGTFSASDFYIVEETLRVLLGI